MVVGYDAGREAKATKAAGAARRSPNTVTVSPKFQVVIPLRVRQQLGLQPGQKFVAYVEDNRVVLAPFESIKSLRGFMKGIDTTVVRDPDREL